MGTREVVFALFVLTLHSDVSRGQAPQLTLKCTGESFQSVEEPPLKCEWAASNAKYVLITPFDTLQRALTGSIEFSGAGPYFFLAVGDSGIASRWVSQVVTYRQVGSLASLRVTATVGPFLTNPSFRRSISTNQPRQRVVAELVNILQSLGFITALEEGGLPAERSRVGMVSVTSLTAANAVYHQLLCDTVTETDCDAAPQARRITRLMTLGAMVLSDSSGYELRITPTVTARYRREGGPFRPDTTALPLAVKVCESISATLLTKLVTP